MAERKVTCQELVELITGYLDDALPGDERQAFERHLARCPGCGIYLAQMNTTRRLLGTLAVEDIPEPMRRDLLAAFRGRRESDTTNAAEEASDTNGASNSHGSNAASDAPENR